MRVRVQLHGQTYIDATAACWHVHAFGGTAAHLPPYRALITRSADQKVVDAGASTSHRIAVVVRTASVIASTCWKQEMHGLNNILRFWKTIQTWQTSLKRQCHDNRWFLAAILFGESNGCHKARPQQTTIARGKRHLHDSAWTLKLFIRLTEMSWSDVRDTCVSSRHFCPRKKKRKISLNIMTLPL